MRKRSQEESLLGLKATVQLDEGRSRRNKIAVSQRQPNRTERPPHVNEGDELDLFQANTKHHATPVDPS